MVGSADSVGLSGLLSLCVLSLVWEMFLGCSPSAIQTLSGFYFPSCSVSSLSAVKNPLKIPCFAPGLIAFQPLICKGFAVGRVWFI